MKVSLITIVIDIYKLKNRRLTVGQQRTNVNVTTLRHMDVGTSLSYPTALVH